MASPEMVPGQEYMAQYGFTGKWMPAARGALIGAENYRVLQNTRYTDQSVEGVRGYSKINTTVLSHVKIRNGHQLKTDRTTPSYVLVQAYNALETESKLFVNKTAIPSAGDFVATALHTDMAGADIGRFSDAPGGNVTYCNGRESMIWAGEEMRCAGFFTVDSAALANPRDYTDAVNNTLDTTGNLAALTATQRYFLVQSTRPLQGIHIQVKTVNATAATMAVTYWNGSSFAAVAGLSDGTTDAGATLAKDGEVSFTSTVAVAKPYHFQGTYLYSYRFQITDGTAEIEHVSVNAPLQAVVDVWDGVFRQPIQFQVSRVGVYEEYTLEVNESSSAQYPIAALLGGLASTDHVILMFDEPQAGIKLNFIAGKTNAVAATSTIKYWDGDSFEVVTAYVDGTISTAKTMAQSGLLSWLPPGRGVEFPTTLFGVRGYAYKLEFSATLTAGTASDGVSVDTVVGIPMQNTVRGFDFPSMYKGMALLCSFSEGKEGNRVDFSMSNAADVWNGEMSSRDGLQSLYFGGTDKVVAGTQLYNRFGSNIFSTWISLKRGETWLLNGDTPEDFQIYPISFNIGCSAPLTLATAELGFEMAEDLVRNVAIWLSYSGPVMFDGAVLMPLDGVENYFDPAEDECVNYAAIDKARGWYDTTYREYNLLLPSGTGQTDCNVWLIYDMQRKKWFAKDTGTAYLPQCGLAVTDEDSVRYTYGGIDTGRLMRLENGTNWDGVKIQQIIETGDFWPTGNLWHVTLIRRIKVIARRIDESHIVAVSHVLDTEDGGLYVTFTADEDISFADTEDVMWGKGNSLGVDLNVAGSIAEIVRDTEETNYRGYTHRFRFEVSTGDSLKGFQPIGWGFMYRIERFDR